MSTAPSESAQLQPDTAHAPPRHLRAVESELGVARVASVAPTDIRQREFDWTPDPDPHSALTTSRDVMQRPRRMAPRRRAATRNKPTAAQTKQVAAMKELTQAIGAAFVETELGIRPFAQLSSWLELELFQKLRARVALRAHDTHEAVKRGDPELSKMPAITPIGARASRTLTGDWEASTTIRVGDRARAFAMRLQRHRNRWRVVAFEVG